MQVTFHPPLHRLPEGVGTNGFFTYYYYYYGQMGSSQKGHKVPYMLP